MSNRRRPRQTKNAPRARSRTNQRRGATTTSGSRRKPKAIVASPQIERDIYVPNNLEYFSTTSNLHNYVGDNGDLFPHLNDMAFDRDQWQQSSGSFEAPSTSPRNLAAVVAAFDCSEYIDRRSVQCDYYGKSASVYKEQSSSRAMSSFPDGGVDDSLSDKVILRQLLLGDSDSYPVGDSNARKPAAEKPREMGESLRTLYDRGQFDELFRDNVGTVVDQADFLQGIYGFDQDDKIVVSSSVDPAEHCVPVPDLTSPNLSKFSSSIKPVAENLTIAYDLVESSKDFLVENLLMDTAVDDSVDYYCDMDEYEEILETIWKDLPAPKSIPENHLETSCDLSTLETPQRSVSSSSDATLPSRNGIDDTTLSINGQLCDNEVEAVSDRSASSPKLHNATGDDDESSPIPRRAVSSSLTGVAATCDFIEAAARLDNSTENLLKVLEDEDSIRNSIEDLAVELNEIFHDDHQEMIYKTNSPTSTLDHASTSPLISSDFPCSSPATLAAIASIIDPYDSVQSSILAKRKRTSSFSSDCTAAKNRRTAPYRSPEASNASTRLNESSRTTQQQRYDDCALGNAAGENGNSTAPRYDAAATTPAVLELASKLAASKVDTNETLNRNKNADTHATMDQPCSSSPGSVADKASENLTLESTHKIYWKKKIKYSRSLSKVAREDSEPTSSSALLEQTITATTTVDDENEEKTDAKLDSEVASTVDEPSTDGVTSERCEWVKEMDVSRGRSVKARKKFVRSKKIRKPTSRAAEQQPRRTRSQSKQEASESEQAAGASSSTVNEPKEPNSLPKLSLNLLIQKNIVDFTPVLDLNLIHENLYRRHVKFLQLTNLTIAKCKVMRKTLHRDRFRLQQIISLMEKLSKLLYYYYVWECRELKRERKSDDSTVYNREWEESKRREIVENMETTLPMTGNQRFDSKIFEHFHSFLQTLSDESSRSTQTFHAKERLLYDSLELPHVYSSRSILLPVKQYVRSYVHNALSYDTCKSLLESDGNVREKTTTSKSIGVSANANAQTAASLSVCLVEKQIPSIEELSERGGGGSGSVPRTRCVQSWKREYEKFYYTLNFLFIINYKFVLYSHHCNFLISNLSKRDDEQTTGFEILPQSFWRKSGEANFPYIFMPILKGHTLSNKLDMSVPSPGNPQTPASVRPVEFLDSVEMDENNDAEIHNDEDDDVLTAHSEQSDSTECASGSEEIESLPYPKPTIINVLTLQKNESPIIERKIDSVSPSPLSVKIVCEQKPTDNCSEKNALEILEINRQRNEALNRQECFEKTVAAKESDIEHLLQHQLNMVKILNQDSMDFLDTNDTAKSSSDSRRINSQYSLLERVALRAFFFEMSMAEKQQTLNSIKEQQYLFSHLERKYLEHHYQKDKRLRLSDDCVFLEDKSRLFKSV